MKRTLTDAIFLFCLSTFLLFLFSCKKNLFGDGNDCNQLMRVKAHHIAPVTKGGTIELNADQLDGAIYYWTNGLYFQSYSQNNILTTNANYTDRGWYYLNVTLPDCNPKYDSIYVDVKFPQGTPSCTPANNSASFSGSVLLGDQTYYYVNFGSTSDGYGVTANSMNGDMRINMSSYWLTHDLEDGIYYTTNFPTIDSWEIGKIYLSNVNNSILWVAEPDMPVYISHVGGKQQITFCNLTFSGDFNGNLYHTNVSSKITQP